MARKPARMWRRIKRPYTRTEYIDGAPGTRIKMFDMGNLQADFPIMISLVAKDAVQIRENALEAARVIANKYIAKMVGSGNYRLKLRIYPHHILREHKMAVGAGADRVSQGMRAAYGRPVGRAAQVKPGTKIISIWIRPEHFDFAKEAFRRASMKLPTDTKIEIEKGVEFLRGKI
ncbi:MAG: 50S ribosomal protein L16 [Archaeoglobaceae archaeon]|nr:50S ribosomal protein L16 [Archaeoglobaceae archaeon]